MHNARMSNASIAPVTRAGAVANELRRMIASGELPPGLPLRQADIAERFGVSTTPVREAFAALAHEGLVRKDAHRGVVVFQSSLDELRETYELREVLEPFATALAVPMLAPEAMDALEGLICEMRAATDPASYSDLNREFHRQIYVASGRQRLVEMIEQLREAAGSYLGITVREYDPSYKEQAHREHEAIHEALTRRDAELAAELMREHLEHNAHYLEARFAQRD